MALDALNARISNLTAGITDPRMLEVVRKVQVILREFAPSLAASKVSRVWVGETFPAEVEPNDLLVDKNMGIVYINDTDETDFFQQKVVGPEVMTVDSNFSGSIWLCRRGPALGEAPYGQLEQVINVGPSALWTIGQRVLVIPTPSPNFYHPVSRVSFTPQM